MAALNVQDVVSGDFDYAHWSSIAKRRLVENGVWDVVQNEVSPDPTKIPEIAATIKVVDLAQWRNLVIKEMKALKIMQSSLPDSVFRKTISVTSAKDLWDLLKKGNDNEEAKLRRLENQFEKLMMCEGESMEFYLDRVLHITEQFRVSGKPKSDDQVISKLLKSLSRSYDDAVPVLEELMNLPDMTLNDLIGAFDIFGDHPETMPHELKDFVKYVRKAKSEQLWCGVCNKYSHSQEDCYYNPRVLNSSGAKQFRRQCFQCGEIGHYPRDCHNMQVGQKRIVKADHFTYDEDMWMIYNTTSSHMTPYEKFFTTLDRTFRAEVELADGNVIMAEGKGDVKIIMKGVRMTITNVLFVPGLNRNVLSFGQMAKRGYSMEMGGGECTIRDVTGKIFAQTMREKRGISLRLQVIERSATQAQIVQNRNQKPPEHMMLAVTFGRFTFDEDMWMIYSNTSNHMTPHEKYFTTLDRSYRARVGLANGIVIMAEGKGNVMIMMKGVKKMITNVLYVPRVNRNVLSIGQMTSRGYTVMMGGGECIIKDENGKVFAKTMGEERGYALRLQVIERYSL